MKYNRKHRFYTEREHNGLTGKTFPEGRSVKWWGGWVVLILYSGPLRTKGGKTIQKKSQIRLLSPIPDGIVPGVKKKERLKGKDALLIKSPVFLTLVRFRERKEQEGPKRKKEETDWGVLSVQGLKLALPRRPGG